MKETININVSSHTLYAYDIMIFCRGDIRSIRVVNNLLDKYEVISGKTYNASKSIIYAGAMSIAREY